MKKFLVTLLVNFAVLSSLIVAMELIGQLYFFARNGKFVFQKAPGYYGDLFEIHPYLAGRLRKNAILENDGKRITTSDIHTRTAGCDLSSGRIVRIAALGGSTTFGTGVTDEDTWPYLLQSLLGNNYCVVNFGVPGYSTAESIVQMALIVPEFKPHFVIVCHGWNDIRNYHEEELGADYYGHGIRQFANLSIAANCTDPMKKLQDVSGLFHYLTKIRTFASSFTTESPSKTLAYPDPFVDRIYLRNLKTIKLLSENLSAHTILVPQVLNWQNFADPVGWSRHIDHRSMRELVNRFNGLMQSVCSDEEKSCVFVDISRNIKWTNDDFVDNGHFSRTGGQKLAEILAGEIMMISGRPNP